MVLHNLVYKTGRIRNSPENAWRKSSTHFKGKTMAGNCDSLSFLRVTPRHLSHAIPEKMNTCLLRNAILSCSAAAADQISGVAYSDSDSVDSGR